MSWLSSTLLAAAVALAAASSTPAQAITFRPGSAVINSEGPVAGVEIIRDRHRRHYRRRHDGGDHFSFGFGFPFVYQPYVYQPYAYRTYQCPYGYWFDYRYGCVAVQPYYYYPYDYRSRPGVILEFGF